MKKICKNIDVKIDFDDDFSKSQNKIFNLVSNEFLILEWFLLSVWGGTVDKFIKIIAKKMILKV